MNKAAIQDLIDQMKGGQNENYRAISKVFKDCVKFKLPLNAEILEINHNLSNKERYLGLIPLIKLPYHFVLLEYVMQVDSEKIDVVIAAKELAECICFQVYVKFPNAAEWTIFHNMGGINKSWDDFKIFNIQERQSEIDELELACIQSGAIAILNLLAALNCSNVSVGAESIKIKKRFGSKKAKPKLMGEIIYKTLIIDTQAIKAQDEQGGVGNGSSKKQHLRRGHIRRLKDKTIWVNSCVVGDKDKGLVEKDYKVI